jgi:hypothetical protein
MINLRIVPPSVVNGDAGNTARGRLMDCASQEFVDRVRLSAKNRPSGGSLPGSGQVIPDQVRPWPCSGKRWRGRP